MGLENGALGNSALGQIIHHLFSFAGILAIVVIITFATVFRGIPIGLAMAGLPFVLIFLLVMVRNPYWGLIALFLINYFVVAIIRYTGVSGLSVMIDGLIAITLIATMVSNLVKPVDYRSGIQNGLMIAALIWFGFCCLELLNPSALSEAWFYSRGLTYYFLVMTLLTFLIFRSYKDIKTVLYILSVLTLLGAAKGAIQQIFGFDYAEMAFLNSGSAKTHLLRSGTRYFSFFASAGIFGAVMGHAMVVFGIAAIYVKGHWHKSYFLIVAVAACYGMIISGTRGALAVPMAGFVLFLFLAKKTAIIIPSAIVIIGVIGFLSLTTIGQSNQYIRRMRSAFDTNEPSLVVRKNNQKLFAAYLADKPFGEGLGLSGVDAQEMSRRYTTSIPTDSWYVKIWVETGVVGLILHISIFLYFLIYGSILIFFKIQNYQLKGLLTALICGVFGILVASYGNQVLGQYPVSLIVYMSMAFVFMGKYFDKQMESQNQTTII